MKGWCRDGTIKRFCELARHFDKKEMCRFSTKTEVG
jgi:hypothetical protein